MFSEEYLRNGFKRTALMHDLLVKGFEERVRAGMTVDELLDLAVAVHEIMEDTDKELAWYKSELEKLTGVAPAKLMYAGHVGGYEA